jgi:hypothetical protein
MQLPASLIVSTSKNLVAKLHHFLYLQIIRSSQNNYFFKRVKNGKSLSLKSGGLLQTTPVFRG